MLIGVISDIHDHLPRLRMALERLSAAGAEALICCGDLCSPFIIDELVEGFPAGEITIVFGNNDGDRYRITAKAMNPRRPNVRVRGESATLELGGKRIFVHHFADVGSLVAASGQFDLVCYGHDHEYRNHREPGASLELNPGAIMGWHPTRGDIASTYAVYDTGTGEAVIRDTETGDEVG
ncbi:MAG: YfcE family phosphodiesterase [Thermomicrobiales bacterium]